MKKYLIAILLVLPTSLLSGKEFQTPTSNVTVRDLLENSKKAPKSDTYYLMALSAARKNDIETANKSIATGLSINPRDIKLLNLKGALLAKQGRIVQARQIFLTVLNMKPGDEYAENCLKLIEDNLQAKHNSLKPMVNTKSNYKGKTDAPISPIEEQTISKDKLLTASYFLDLKHKQECSHGMSLIKIAQEKSIARNPKSKNIFSLTNLIKDGLLTSAPVCPKGGAYSWGDNEVICSKHGNFTALDAEVTNVFKEYNTGLRAKLSRNYLEALKSFEQVVILYPLWAEAHYQLGDTLFRLGEVDQAINSLRTCLKHDPENLDAQLLLANLYFKKGQKQAALTILDKISNSQQGTVYGLSSRSVAKSIRSGRSYYEIFPPN
jgi:tetratricopeptide (TPR) repeat protein